MEEEKKAEAEQGEKSEAVLEQGQVQEEEVVLKKSEVDAMIKTAQDAAEIARKKTEEAADAKKGMFKYKNMLKDNGIEEEEVAPALTEDRITQIVQAAIANAIPENLKPKSEDELEIANRKIEEMRVTLANRKSVGSSAAGSNVDKDNVTVKTDAEKYFSADQIADIKKRFPHADIEQVYKNLPKVGDMSGAPIN